MNRTTLKYKVILTQFTCDECGVTRDYMHTDKGAWSPHIVAAWEVTRSWFRPWKTRDVCPVCIARRAFSRNPEIDVEEARRLLGPEVRA